MKASILKYINELEGFKTAIKNLHWSSSNMSEHKLFDDIASSVADIQDKVSEIAQGISGKFKLNELKPKRYKISSSKAFLKDLLKSTRNFHETLSDKKYIGIKSEIETFIGDVQQFQYLLAFCLKEDRQQMKKVIKEDMEDNLLQFVNWNEVYRQIKLHNRWHRDIYVCLIDKGENYKTEISDGYINSAALCFKFSSDDILDMVQQNETRQIQKYNLTETDLHNIIRRSVEQILRESGKILMGDKARFTPYKEGEGHKMFMAAQKRRPEERNASYKKAKEEAELRRK